MVARKTNHSTGSFCRLVVKPPSVSYYKGDAFTPWVLDRLLPVIVSVAQLLSAVRRALFGASPLPRLSRAVGCSTFAFISLQASVVCLFIALLEQA